jgi:hypothetical protein
LASIELLLASIELLLASIELLLQCSMKQSTFSAKCELKFM